MTRTRRRVAIAVAVVAFLAASAVVARWLQADNAERAKVERLLAAQGRGDAAAMAREIDRCDAGCRAELDDLAEQLSRPGELEIVRYDSPTAHAITSDTGPTRVVWQLPGTLPTVQCIGVRRTGNALTGPGVTLLSLSEPIERESSC
jgi:uncharacterized membrane protein